MGGVSCLRKEARKGGERPGDPVSSTKTTHCMLAEKKKAGLSRLRPNSALSSPTAPCPTQAPSPDHTLRPSKATHHARDVFGGFTLADADGVRDDDLASHELEALQAEPGRGVWQGRAEGMDVARAERSAEACFNIVP